MVSRRAKILMALPLTTLMEVEFEDEGSGEVILCSMLMDGTLGPGGGAEVTAILSLGGVEVTRAAPLLCKSLKVCEESTTDVEWSPAGLPWKTTLVLRMISSEDLFFSASY